MSQTRTNAGLQISTPGNWVALDLDALAEEELADEIIDERIAELPLLAPHREGLARVLSRSAAAARDSGVAFAAVMIDLHEDETPMLASLTVAVVDWAGEPPVVGPGAQTVVLPAGEAVCVERVYPTAIVDGGADLLVLTTQYLVAIPGSRALAALTFTSPNLLERDQLCSMFRRIAETLEPPCSAHRRCHEAAG